MPRLNHVRFIGLAIIASLGVTRPPLIAAQTPLDPKTCLPEQSPDGTRFEAKPPYANATRRYFATFAPLSGGAPAAVQATGARFDVGGVRVDFEALASRFQALRNEPFALPGPISAHDVDGAVIVAKKITVGNGVRTYGRDLVVVADEVTLTGSIDTRGGIDRRSAGNLLVLARGAVSIAPGFSTQTSAPSGERTGRVTILAATAPAAPDSRIGTLPKQGLAAVAANVIPAERTYLFAEAQYRALSFARAGRSPSSWDYLEILYRAAAAAARELPALRAAATTKAAQLEQQLSYVGEPRWVFQSVAPELRIDEAGAAVEEIHAAQGEFRQLQLLRTLAELEQVETTTLGAVVDTELELLRRAEAEALSDLDAAATDLIALSREYYVAARYVEDLRASLTGTAKTAFEDWVREAEQSCSWLDVIKDFVSGIFGIATGNFGTAAEKIAAAVSAANKVASKTPGTDARQYAKICGREWTPSQLYRDVSFTRLELADLPYYIGSALVLRFQVEAHARQVVQRQARLQAVRDNLALVEERRDKFQLAMRQGSLASEIERLAAQQRFVCQLGQTAVDHALALAYRAASAIDFLELPTSDASGRAASFAHDYNFIASDRGPLQLLQLTNDLQRDYNAWLNKKRVRPVVLDTRDDPAFAATIAREGRYVFEVSTRGLVPFGRPRLVAPYLVVQPGARMPLLRLRRIGAAAPQRGNPSSALGPNGAPLRIPPSLVNQPQLDQLRVSLAALGPADMAFPLREGGFASYPAFAVRSSFSVVGQGSSAETDGLNTESLHMATVLPWFGLLPDGLWSLEPLDSCQANEPACRRNHEDFKQIRSVQVSFGIVGDG